MRELVGRHADTLGVDEAGESRLRERVSTLQEENERLRKQVQGQPAADAADAQASDDAVPLSEAGLETLVNHDAVQVMIDTAKEDGPRASERYDEVIGALVVNAEAGGEGLTAKQLAEALPRSETTYREVVKDLTSTGVVEAAGRRPTKYYLDREQISRRVKVARRQQSLSAEGDESGGGA